jgi:hypothetical protein
VNVWLSGWLFSWVVVWLCVCPRALVIANVFVVRMCMCVRLTIFICKHVRFLPKFLTSFYRSMLTVACTT